MLYLCHLVGSGHLEVPEARAKAMQDYILPKTKKGLRRFLGTISYYRKFIPNMADYTAKLTPAMAKAAPSQIQCKEDKSDAFYHLRSVLVNVCVKNVPAPGDEFVLQTDASLLGVGSVLNIVRIQEELLVAYFARQLRKVEKSYSATELEERAVVESV